MAKYNVQEGSLVTASELDEVFAQRLVEERFGGGFNGVLVEVLGFHHAGLIEQR